MDSSENEAAVRRWFQAFNDGNVQAEADARAENFVAHVPGAPVPLDNAGWPQFTGAFYSGFPDAKLHVEDVVANGDLVAVRWTFTGTHTGTFVGIPPTGKSVRAGAIEFNRLQDGKVVEHWVQLDQLGILQQIGAIPAPGQS